MASNTCSKCEDNFIVNTKFIKCSFCKNIYHNVCAEIKESTSKAVADSNNLHWFCNECVKVAMNNLELSYKIAEIEKQTEQLVNSQKESFKALEAKISEVKKLVNKGVNKKNQTCESTNENLITKSQVEEAINNAFLSLHTDKLKLESLKKKENVMRGTNNDVTDDFCGQSGKMWLYLGRVTKKANSDSVKNYITRKVKINDECQLEIKQLNTIGNSNSFQIGIDSGYFDVLNDANFWPSHVIFRRFHFKRTKPDSLTGPLRNVNRQACTSDSVNILDDPNRGNGPTNLNRLNNNYGYRNRGSNRGRYFNQRFDQRGRGRFTNGNVSNQGHLNQL